MRRIVILLFALTLAAGSAHAQPAPWQPERLSAGWTFTPSIVFGALWDSNVTVRQEHDPHVQEWVGLLNPRGEIDFNGRQTHFNAGYSGALTAYRNLPELQRYEQHGRFEVRHQLRPRIALYSRASADAAPSTDRLEIAPGVLPFVMIGSQSFNASGGFTGALSARTTLDGSYGFSDVHFQRNTEANRFLRGGHSNTAKLGLMRALTSRLAVGAGYEYRHASVAAGEQIFDVQSTGGEVSYTFTPATSVRGGLGATYMSVPYRDLAMWGPAFHAGLDHNEGAVRMSISGQRGYVPSLAFAGLTQETTVSGGVSRPFGKGRYVASGHLSYGAMRPVEQIDPGLVHLRSVFYTATLGYAINRGLRVEGFYTGAHQTSSARGLIERARIGFQFVTSKPVRIE